MFLRRGNELSQIGEAGVVRSVRIAEMLRPLGRWGVYGEQVYFEPDAAGGGDSHKVVLASLRTGIAQFLDFAPENVNFSECASGPVLTLLGDPLPGAEDLGFVQRHVVIDSRGTATEVVPALAGSKAASFASDREITYFADVDLRPVHAKLTAAPGVSLSPSDAGRLPPGVFAARKGADGWTIERIANLPPIETTLFNAQVALYRDDVLVLDWDKIYAVPKKGGALRLLATLPFPMTEIFVVDDVLYAAGERAVDIVSDGSLTPVIRETEDVIEPTPLGGGAWAWCTRDRVVVWKKPRLGE
jgi:hypothetical protein